MRKIRHFPVMLQYLHSQTISLDEPILDWRGSYTHERQSFTRRYM